MNITNLTLDIHNSTMYNAGCWRELDIMAQKCEDFHVSIVQNIGTRFYIALGLLLLVTLFRLYVTYRKPKWSTTEFFMDKIAYRIDFIEFIIELCIIALVVM